MDIDKWAEPACHDQHISKVVLTAEGYALGGPGAVLLALPPSRPQELEAPLAGVGGDGARGEERPGAAQRAILLVDHVFDGSAAETHCTVRRRTWVAAFGSRSATWKSATKIFNTWSFSGSSDCILFDNYYRALRFRFRF